MSFVSGNGGKISNMTATKDLTIGVWEGNFGARLTENTNSSTGGATNYEKVVDDPSWSAEVPLDLQNLPDTDVGFTGGAKVNAKFFLGGSVKFYTLTGTTIEEVRVRDDNAQDIVRATITGKGGAITRPITG